MSKILERGLKAPSDMEILPMNDETYKLRRKVMDIIYDIKEKIDLPRVDVRITSASVGRVLGKAYKGGNAIFIPVSTLERSQSVLEHVVLHEIGHAVFNLGHHEGSILMQPQMASNLPPLSTQIRELKRLIKLKNESKERDRMYSCECIECGHTMESEKHCNEINCPECGADMRREDRPGRGRSIEGFLKGEVGAGEVLEDNQKNKSEVSALNADIAKDLINAVIEAGIQKKVILNSAMNIMSDDKFRAFINEVTLQGRIRNDEIVDLLDRLNKAS